MNKIRILIIISFLVFINCTNNSVRNKFLNENQVFVSAISWDTSRMETYGSGEIIYFSKNKEFKVFCNSFLKNHDSLSWGEPGIILKIGEWQFTNDKIICKTRTVHRTFKINDSVRTEIDTFDIENQLLKKRAKYYYSNPLLTEELTLFMHKDWNKIKE